MLLANFWKLSLRSHNPLGVGALDVEASILASGIRSKAGDSLFISVTAYPTKTLEACWY